MTDCGSRELAIISTANQTGGEQVLKRLAAGAALLAMLPSPAAAEGKIDRGHGSFFNRPGATAVELAADTAACRAIADGTDSQVNASEVLAGGVLLVFSGLLATGGQKRINIENCLLIRGWRLYAMTRTDGAAWNKLPDATRERELATLVGAETPARGQMLRAWRNDYAEPVFWPKK